MNVVNPEEDPTGRPPINTGEWAVLEREQRGEAAPEVPQAQCHCGCDYTVQPSREAR